MRVDHINKKMNNDSKSLELLYEEKINPKKADKEPENENRGLTAAAKKAKSDIIKLVSGVENEYVRASSIEYSVKKYKDYTFEDYQLLLRIEDKLEIINDILNNTLKGPDLLNKSEKKSVVHHGNLLTLFVDNFNQELPTTVGAFCNMVDEMIVHEERK